MRLRALRDGKRRDRLRADASRRKFRRGGELLSAAIESAGRPGARIEPGEVASQEHAANNSATEVF
jgi:hypothetical protein